MSDEPLFSERMGYKKISDEIQSNDMSYELRNDLWNIYYISMGQYADWQINLQKYNILNKFLQKLWIDYFRRSIDEFRGAPSHIGEIKKLFYESIWYVVYDLLEYSVKNYPYNDKAEFVEVLNSALERNNSAYRFVGDTLTPMVEKEEIKEIEKVLDNPIESVKKHIKTALEHFSDKENPDYRNAIKEAITAVESLAKIISNMPDATLAPALDQAFIILNINNEKLKEAFKNLYGYTNTEGGIRHGSTVISNPRVEDARFIIITCSAFINYLIEKADKAGIKL